MKHGQRMNHAVGKKLPCIVCRYIIVSLRWDGGANSAHSDVAITALAWPLHVSKFEDISSDVCPRNIRLRAMIETVAIASTFTSLNIDIVAVNQADLVQIS